MKKATKKQIHGLIKEGLDLDGELTKIICDHLDIEIDYGNPPELWGENEMMICELTAALSMKIDEFFEDDKEQE